MMRWSYYLILALLSLVPTRTFALDDENDVEEQIENSDVVEVKEDVDEDTSEKDDRMQVTLPTSTAPLVTRTTSRGPLECYDCVFKSAKPQKTCLDPTKYRVQTVMCTSAEDKCFTAMNALKTNSSKYAAVVRGCKSDCIASSNTTCCDLNRCNNQTISIPVVPRAWSKSNDAVTLQPSVLFFITILLILQTVQGCHRIPL